MGDSNRGKGEESPTGNGKVRSRSRSASDGDGSKKNEVNADVTLYPRTLQGRTPHGAMGYFAARRFSKDFSGAVQTDKDRRAMEGEILKGPEKFHAIHTYQRKLREIEYVIQIESLLIQRNEEDGIFNNVDFSFWFPIHEGYRIHIKINFDKLGESDKENMGKVVFWNSRWGKICSLLDLYLCTKGVLSEYIEYHFMGLEFKNKTYGLKHSFKMALEDGYLTIEGDNNRPLLDVILKAGELSDKYPQHTRPYLLGMIRTVLTNRRQRGGRVQRQRRRGRTILSRKKRNTRMKKSKKYNKSKKIKK